MSAQPNSITVEQDEDIDEFAESILRAIQTLSLELADVAGDVDEVFHRVSSQTEYLVELTTLAQQSCPTQHGRSTQRAEVPRSDSVSQ